MLAPELIRIQEKPAANWVPPAKVNAIRGEFMRQCDKLDGLVDGAIDNYMACRAIFDVKQGDPNRNPWAAKRCPNHVDPNPRDTSAGACADSRPGCGVLGSHTSKSRSSMGVCARPAGPLAAGVNRVEDPPVAQFC